MHYIMYYVLTWPLDRILLVIIFNIHEHFHQSQQKHFALSANILGPL